MALGEILTSLRKAKGLSQEQLAEELKLTRQTISKWELNQSTPDLTYILHLSNFFGVSTDYLIKGAEDSAPRSSSDTNSEASDPEEAETSSENESFYKWLFILGAVLMAVCFLGIMALVICSALEPWGAIVGSMYFEGLLGFLFGTNTLWFFIVLLVLMLLGCGIAAYAIVKKRN